MASASEEQDVIARNAAAARALSASRALPAALAELGAATAALLAAPGVEPALAAAGEAVAGLRASRLDGEVASLRSQAASLTQDARPRRLPVENALACLEPAPPARLAQALSAAASDLRRHTIRLQLARDALLQEAGSPLARVEGFRQARASHAGACDALRASWRDLLAWAASRPQPAGASPLASWEGEVRRREALPAMKDARARAHLARCLPFLLHCLTGEAGAMREAIVKALLEQFPAERGEAPDLGPALAAFAAACRRVEGRWAIEELAGAERWTIGALRRLVARLGAETAARLFGKPPAELEAALALADDAPLELSLAPAALEDELRAAASDAARAKVRLAAALSPLCRDHPLRFLRAFVAAGLQSPSLVKRCEALRAAQEAVDAHEEVHIGTALAAQAATDESRSAGAQQLAMLEAVKVRREVRAGLDREAIESRARRGFTDPRTRLQPIDRMLQRDLERLKRSFFTLTDPDQLRYLGERATVGEIAEFLESRTTVRVERGDRCSDGGAAAGSEAPAVAAHARPEAGVGGARPRDQALCALVMTELELCGWKPDGNTQAERLLRPFAAAATREGAAFLGLPRTLDPSPRCDAPAGADLEDNAMAALAAQLHVWATGAEDLLPLAAAIADRVLLPAAGAAATRAPGDSGEPAGASALAAAALLNQGRIHEALGEPEKAAVYLAPAGRWLEALADRWRDGLQRQPPADRGREDLSSSLLALAVLSQDPRFEPRFGIAGAREVTRALRERFLNEVELRQRFDARAFRGNWFLGGPVEAFNRFVVDGLEHIAGAPEVQRLEDRDAWFGLNQQLFDLSGGRLGFTVRAQGLRGRSGEEGIDFSLTARAAWVLQVAARRLEETAREPGDGGLGPLAQQLLEDLDGALCSDPEGRHRGWPLGSDDLARVVGSSETSDAIATSPACWWLLARLARRGFHPLVPGPFARLAERRQAGARQVTAATSAAPAPGLDLASGIQGLRAQLLAAGASLEARLADVRSRIARARGQTSDAGGSPAAAQGGAATASPPLPPSLDATLAWLERRLDPATGLPRTNDDPGHPHACHTYTGALAVIHFSLAAALTGEAATLEQARRVWRALLAVRGQDGAWADAYDARTGAVYEGATHRAVGPNCWMVLAALHLSSVSPDAETIEEARQTMDWVLRFQDLESGHGSRGAVRMGEVPYPDQISTEHNADALAAAWGLAAALPAAEARPYRDAAAAIATWLLNRVWLEEQQRFATESKFPAGAPGDGPERLDSQTWTILALAATTERHGADLGRRNALLALREHVTLVPHQGRRLVGFAKVTLGPPAFWAEGVAGYVLAARRLGLPTAEFTASLAAVRRPDGSLPYLLGAEEHSEWEFHLPVAAIDGTVWSTWAESEIDFNPFRIGGVTRRSDATASPATQVERLLDEERRLEAEQRQHQALWRDFEALEKSASRLQEDARSE
jgi:hypothetical protein